MSLSPSLRQPGPRNRKGLSWRFSDHEHWTASRLSCPESKPRDSGGKTQTPHVHTHSHHMRPHTYITQPHETYCPPIIVLGFQPGLLVAVSRKDNVKYPYSILRKTKPLSVSLTLLLLRLCMMPFTVYFTLPPERFGFGEIPPPAQPSPPSASLYPQELVDSHTAKSRGILISPRPKF